MVLFLHTLILLGQTGRRLFHQGLKTLKLTLLLLPQPSPSGP